MKKYRFEVVVTEGSDEFWEELTATGNSGCDLVKGEIQDACEEKFVDVTVELVEYKNDNR